jgi:hypothetical protein
MSLADGCAEEQRVPGGVSMFKIMMMMMIVMIIITSMPCLWQMAVRREEIY